MFQIFTDGASRGNPGNSGIGVVIFREGKEYDEISSFVGKKTNNEAEYLAVIRALEWMHRENVQKAVFFSDSQLLVRQLSGVYKVKAPTIKPLFKNVKELLLDLDVSFVWIRREENSKADILANQAIDNHLSSM